MSEETAAVLKKSLDAVDAFRRRVLLLGWVVVAATLVMYVRLAYLHRTTDSIEPLLGASVAALTFLIAWTTFAIIVTITRATRSILRAIDASSRRDVT